MKKEKRWKLETSCGDDFTTVSKEASDLAKSRNIIVEFDFNGVKCLVDKDTKLNWLARDYHNSFTMKWKTIGTKCVAKYSKETTDKLKARKKELAEKQAIERAKYKEEERKEKKRNALREKPMALKLNYLMKKNGRNKKTSIKMLMVLLQYSMRNIGLC